MPSFIFKNTKGGKRAVRKRLPFTKMLKIKVKKSEILPALKSASRAVSPRNPLPVLTGLKLAAQDGSLVVTGTDLK